MGAAFPIDLAPVTRSLSALGDRALARLPYVVIAVIVLVALWLLGKVVARGVAALLDRARVDRSIHELVVRATTALFGVLGVVVAAVVVFPSFQFGDVVAGLGITSIAIGFALKDVLQNFVAGILLLVRRPFRIGDQIRTKDHEGTVEEIDLRSTRILTYDGERVIVPNGEVYTSIVVVRTARPLRRVKVRVGIGYQDAIEDARRAIARVLDETEGVATDPGPWIHVVELAPSSVDLQVYFWTGSKQANVLAVSDRVVTGIKNALDAAGIDMPYPHTVMLVEGGGARERPPSSSRRGGRPAPAQA